MHSYTWSWVVSFASRGSEIIAVNRKPWIFNGSTGWTQLAANICRLSPALTLDLALWLCSELYSAVVCLIVRVLGGGWKSICMCASNAYGHVRSCKHTVYICSGICGRNVPAVQLFYLLFCFSSGSKNVRNSLHKMYSLQRLPVFYMYA